MKMEILLEKQNTCNISFSMRAAQLHLVAYERDESREFPF